MMGRTAPSGAISGSKGSWRTLGGASPAGRMIVSSTAETGAGGGGMTARAVAGGGSRAGAPGVANG